MAYQPYRLFNAEAIFLEEQKCYYLTHSWGNKGVRTFPNGISQKVNVIKRLACKLDYYKSAAHRFNHYTTGAPHVNKCVIKDLLFITKENITFIPSKTFSWKFNSNVYVNSNN